MKARFWRARLPPSRPKSVAGEQGIRFLLVSGKPLKEPVAWYGPIVMNTQEQLRKAFEQLNEGTFLEGAAPAKPS